MKKRELNDEDAKPPIFKSWNTWYLLVIGNLIFLIVIFYIFTIAFR